MLDVHRATEVITTALHVIGGLSSAVEHIIRGDIRGSLKVAIAVAACILILNLGVALAKIIRVQVAEYVRRHEMRNKEGPEP